jgi:hypothetical protein
MDDTYLWNLADDLAQWLTGDRGCGCARVEQGDGGYDYICATHRVLAAFLQAHVHIEQGLQKESGDGS